MAKRYKIEQCEGCSDPLSSYIEEYNRGEVDVTWVLCPAHAEPVRHGYEEIDYPEDQRW